MDNEDEMIVMVASNDVSAGNRYVGDTSSTSYVAIFIDVI